MTDSDTPILTARRSDRRHGLGAKSATPGDLDEDLVRLVTPDLSGDSTSSGTFIGQKSKVHAQPRDTDPVLGFDGVHAGAEKPVTKNLVPRKIRSGRTKHCRHIRSDSVTNGPPTWLA